MKMRKLWPVMGLALISYGFFFVKVGEKSIWSKDIEGLRAEVVREMVASGDWMIPHLNGEVLITKPPLYYWLAGFFSLLLGEVTEYSTRLPSVVGAFLGLLGTFTIGLRLFNRRVAWLSALILASSPLYIIMARSITIDVTLTWLTTATLGCFVWSGLMTPVSTDTQPINWVSNYSKEVDKYCLWAFAFMGLAVMTKGPIGIMVPMLPVLGYLLIYRSSGQWIADSKQNAESSRRMVENRLLTIYSLLPTLLKGMGIFLLLTLPWFLLIYYKVPEAQKVLYQETLFRYERLSYQSAKPFYFYFIALLGTFAPWSLFLPCGFVTVMEKFKKKTLPPQVIFLFLWFWPGFFIFSLTSTKRDYYLLPLYPAMALFVGWIWDTYTTESVTPWQQKFFSFSVLSIALIILFSAIGFPVFVYYYFPDLLREALMVGFMHLVLGSFIFLLFFKRRFYLAFGGIILTLGVILGSVLTLVLPKVDPYRTRKDFFQEISTIAGSNTLTNYRYNGYDLPFYTKRVVPVIEEPSQLHKLFKSPNKVYVVMEEISFNSFKLEKIKKVLTREWIDPLNPKKIRRMVLISN